MSHMQWYQHTRPAQLQLVLDEYLDENFVGRHEDDDGTTKEKYRCANCGGETYWAIYDHRNPIAGCIDSECPVTSRMGILEVLEHHLPQEHLEEIPDGPERKKLLTKKLNEISARHLAEEERRRQEEIEVERGHLREVRADRDRWRRTAKSWHSEAERRGGQAAGEAATREKIEAELRRSVDKKAMERGVLWGTAAFVLTCVVLPMFLARAGAGMFFSWPDPKAFMYVALIASAFAFLAFSTAHRDATRAKARNESPRALHERLGWQLGLRWATKIAAYVVVPYVMIGAFGRSTWFASFLPRDGVEWLLVVTVTAAVSALATCASMAEDLGSEDPE